MAISVGEIAVSVPGEGLAVMGEVVSLREIGENLVAGRISLR
jgi:hypothetical protein